jgi:hypothetical protein
MARLRDRPTGDLIVLVIVFTVCFAVIATGLLVALSTFINPEVDTSRWVIRTTGVINTMIGLVGGWFAGRADYQVMKEQRDADRDSQESS